MENQKMKKVLIIVPIFLIFIVNFGFSIDFRYERNFKTITQKYDSVFEKFHGKKGYGWKQWQRWKNFWEPRLFNADSMPDSRMILNSLESYKSKLSPEKLLDQNSDWKIIGPQVVPENKLSYPAWGVGRINVVRLHPTLQNTIFVGAATGGLWKSTDKGQSWNNIPMTDIMSIGISDIAISESNPNVIYLATGDRDGYIQQGSYSVGIMKSTDGGNLFKIIGLNSDISQGFIVTRVLVHPNNPDVVIAAASNGIYKSTDGGVTWNQKMSDGLYRDMEFVPGTPSTMYATAYGSSQYNGGIILRSTNTGDTWTVVKNITNANRIELGVTPATPTKVYALCSSRNNDFGGFYLSTNKGDSWTVQSTTPNILGLDVNGASAGGQGFYDLALTVSPVYDDDIYIGGMHIWKSSDGGKTWRILNHWVGGFGLPYLHADQHDLIIDPKNLDLYSANDGGLSVSHDNGGKWNDLSNGMSITQFYRLSNLQNSNNTIIGGAQDNGTFLYKNGTWMNVLGGDGMEAIVDNTNDQYLYASSQSGEIYRSDNGGNSFGRILSPSLIGGEYAEWTTPYVLNPLKQSTIYVGYLNVYKSTNRGNNWTRISNFSSAPLTFLAVAPSDSNVIYAVSRNTLLVTYDGGANWSVITTQNQYITSLAVDESNPKHLWFCESGYSNKQKVFEVNNFKVENISFNMPNTPINTIVKQKETTRTLFVGTDVGVFKLDDFNDTWIEYNDGMPPLVISELEINYGIGKLRAATWGRGIWESEIFHCSAQKPVMSVIGDLNFCDGDSVKLKIEGIYKQVVWSNGDTGRTATVKQAGIYWATIKDFDGCTSISDKVNIEVNSVPKLKISAQNDGYLCGLDSISLFAGIGFSKYRWNTGDSISKIYVKTPGTYIVQGTTFSGCFSKPDTVVVETGIIPEKPDLFRISDTLYTNPGYKKYDWYVEGNLIATTTVGFFPIPKIGNYTVVVTNSTGCANISDPLFIESDVNEYNEQSGFPVLLSGNEPGKYILNLKTNYGISNEMYKLVLVDNMGRILKNELVPVGDFIGGFTVDLSAYSSGAYYLVLSTASEKSLYKLLKTD